jgi:uncharacterized protein
MLQLAACRDTCSAGLGEGSLGHTNIDRRPAGHQPGDDALTGRQPASRVRILCATACILAVSAVTPAWAQATDNALVITQIYTTGGGANRPSWRNDYVEILNRGSAPVVLDGKSLQYASGTGAGTFAQNPVTLLGGTLEAGQYYLVQLGSSGAAGALLPAADATGTVNLDAASGKLALVNASSGLPCNTAPTSSTGTRCTPAQLELILDLAGYGAANFFEGAAPAPSPTSAASIYRASNGCRDTNDNAADFAAETAAPRNRASPATSCAFEASCPASLETLAGTPVSTVLTARNGSGGVSAAAILGTPVPGIELTGFTPVEAPGEDASVTLAVGDSTAPGAYLVQVQFSSTQTPDTTASCTVQVTVGSIQPGVVRIHDIQGSGHRSPLASQGVTNVPGIVTALRPTGFYLQDPEPDADPATSEGIFVFTQTAPTAQVGSGVLVSGVVTEFRPGGEQSNLTSTNITASEITVLSVGNSLPAPTIIGAAGRVPPVAVIDGGNCGDVELAGCTFDAANDGIDFYESLEGMRVRIDNAVAVGPTSQFGETPVVSDFSAGATQVTPRGGVFVSPSDFNPERVILDDQILFPLPAAGTGDRLGTVVGVLDYSFGAFKLQVTEPFSVSPNPPTPENTAPQAPAELAIAALNLENLHASSDPAKFAALAAQVVGNLASPDILAVSEVQDNSGPVNDGVVDASQTYATLVSAIATAGGPVYHFRNIDPVDGQDGGQPGANIRVGFLFNPARVAFVDRPGGTSAAGTAIVNPEGTPQLTFSPGRIDPANAAFVDSRKPLAGEFRFNGHTVFVVANHFNSKGGDSPLFGRFQPPAAVTQAQREQQASVVRDFVRSVLELDGNASVVVLGDLNDFQFSGTLAILKSTPLDDLGDQLADSDRYTYVFEGNSQALDHVLVTGNLAKGAAYDVVHMNAEYAERASDHDAVIARLYLPAIEVTDQTGSQISGLLLNRATQMFNGFVQMANASAAPIAGPIHILLDDLADGVWLANKSGELDGAPYITYPGSLAPGEGVTIPVQFINPLRARINYSLRVFSGNF